MQLFPFDSSGRLGGQVEQDAVDAFHLGGDAGDDLVQDLVGDLLDGGGHCVLGVNGADDCRPDRKTHV